MMLAWSFPARTVADVLRLIPSLGKHRYVREVDHRIHFSVDRALSGHPLFAPHAEAFNTRVLRDKSLELSSRDPSLFRQASVSEVVEALSVFWSPDAEDARKELTRVIASLGLSGGEHAPFQCPADDPPHPELIQLNWVLFAPDELDVTRHTGALLAMEQAAEEIRTPSEPVYQEGPILALSELQKGVSGGNLVGDFMVWSDGPYAYSDYVFRGVAKSAKLEGVPLGYRDF